MVQRTIETSLAKWHFSGKGIPFSKFNYLHFLTTRKLSIFLIMATKSLKRERSLSTTSSSSASSQSGTSSSYSLPYTIFMYKEELRKGTSEFMRLSKVKLHLTDNLISNTIRNITKYDVSEVININEQMMFKKRLYSKMHKIRKLEKMGIKHIDPNQISEEL